jgi:hypothetical protein
MILVFSREFNCQEVNINEVLIKLSLNILKKSDTVGSFGNFESKFTLITLHQIFK